jgi:hypothetical protein
MAGKITNKDNIRRKAVDSKRYRQLMRRTVERRVNRSKHKLLAEFSAHPVTKEIEAGPTASNYSGLLGGYGNLFSYIGFRSGSNPTMPIKKLLLGIRLLSRRPRSRKKGSLFVNDFVVNFPSPQEIIAFSKMPWEPKSWVYGIERGIDGFGYYMSTKFNGGRSKAGLQAEHKINDVSFRTDNYLPTMLLVAEKMIRRGK